MNLGGQDAAIDSREALRTYLLGQYEALARIEPECADFPCPAINPPLEEDEARDFMRGIEQGLFRVDDHGYFVTPMRRVKGNLFGHEPVRGKRNLSRESIPHVAAAAALVLDYGWPMEQVRIESEDWALDLVVSDQDGRAVIGGEAKATTRALDAMVHEVMSCVLADADCTNREHRKIVGLRSEQPPFFWTVCPGERGAFRVEYLRSRIDLQPVDDIPAAF